VLALQGTEIWLGVCGLIFVAFALITAVLIPRRNPDFPGRNKTLYLVLCFLFFIGMMLAVIFIVPKEPEEEPSQGGGEAAALIHNM
jgi:uncharacterized membrane protein YecN with MAPEG domain